MATLGRAQLERGETSEAVELLQEAATARPEDADIQILYARALLSAGDGAAADKVLEDLTSSALTPQQSARVDELKRQLP